MGRIAKILNFIGATRNGAKIRDAEVNPGGGANVTAPHFAGLGDDSYPLRGDYAALVPDEGSGRENVVGYLDPKNQHKAQPGDKRIYARAGNGDQVVELWLKNDGSAIIDNEAGTFTLNPDGSFIMTNGAGTMTLQTSGEFNINGFIIKTNGDAVTASGVSLSNHTHAQGSDSNGDAEVETDPATATE